MKSKEDNPYAGAASALGGGDKPKKEVKEIRTRKSDNGKYIHEHHHTHPEHHKMEEHVSNNQDEMVEHMMTHMGTPNPGEADADAGQSGIPGDAGAAPAAGAAAAAPGAGAM